MWKMEFPNGELLQDGFVDQWDALKAGFKPDGTRFKKTEALALPSGSVVYKKHFMPVTERYAVVHNDGRISGTYVRKASAPRLQKFYLIEY